jgi:hypothetical protein
MFPWMCSYGVHTQALVMSQLGSSTTDKQGGWVDQVLQRSATSIPCFDHAEAKIY